MAIGTLTEYKTTRGISGSGFDSRITFALEAAESAMEKL